MGRPPKKYSNLTIREKNFVKKTLGITKLEDVDKTILKRLREELKQLNDVRNKNKIIYKLWDVIICTIVASFANNNTWEDIHNFVIDNYEWFKSFLQMTGGIPTEKSYERIMGTINSDELNSILFDFFKTISFEKAVSVKSYNFDGRVNNGSKQKATLLNSSKSPLNCLNVYSNEDGYCIYTKEIDSKTNEIPTVKELVDGMDLNGIIVTWDALNTQVENIKAVINSNGDYTVPIKANHELFYQDLIDYFDEDKCDEIIAGNLNSEYLKYTEKSHSSIIVYELFQTSDVKWYEDIKKWDGVKTFGLVRKTITQMKEVKNKRKNAKQEEVEKEVTTVENRYYISSRTVNINEFNKVTRGHWSVENKIHWQLDFTFDQDKNNTRNKKALLNLEIIHKFVLAILERVKPKYSLSLKSIRKHLSNNIEEFFPELVTYLILDNKSTVLEK